MKEISSASAGRHHDQTKLNIPVIDLEGGISDHDEDLIRRKRTVDHVRVASETWGFFQIVNHGIPVSVMEELKAGVRRFHEQDTEIKKHFYTRDYSKPVIYNSNFDLYSAPSTNCRDTLSISMAPNPPKPEDLPEVCR